MAPVSPKAGSPLSHAHPEPCASLPLAICQQPDLCDVSGAHYLCWCISGPGQTRLCPSLLLGLERSANLTDNAQKQSFSKPGSRTKTRSDKKHLWKISGDTLALGSNSTQGGQGHHLLVFYAVGLGGWSDEAFSCSYVSPLWPQQWGPFYPSGYSLPEPLEVGGGGAGHRGSWAVESRNLPCVLQGTGSLEWTSSRGSRGI